MNLSVLPDLKVRTPHASNTQKNILKPTLTDAGGDIISDTHERKLERWFWSLTMIKRKKLDAGWPVSEEEQVGNVKLEEEVMKTTK